MGIQRGQFRNITGIACSPDESLLIVDSANHRVQAFQADGTFLHGWGEKGLNQDSLNSPSGVAVAPNGKVYVADGYNNGVQIFE